MNFHQGTSSKQSLLLLGWALIPEMWQVPMVKAGTSFPPQRVGGGHNTTMRLM